MDINLRPARPEDAEEMARWFVDLTDLATWGGPEVSFPLTAEQLATWIAEVANERPRICFTAVGDTGLPIGHVQFLREPARQWARLGRFVVAPSLRGNGLGRALFDKSVRMAFEELDVDQLDLAVVPENAVARGLYTRSGFRDIGTMPGSWMIDGRPYVLNLMRLTRADWRKPMPVPAGKVA
jgi:RimJ/RimL family protein N-acetyltransferase